jgi:uncharacterized protein
MRCIIIHGCPTNKERMLSQEDRTYDKHWIPWLKRELISKGVETKTPLMPEPWKPSYEDWKKEMDELGVGEEDVLIGHSCGAGFLVRYLGDMKVKVKKLILVAPAIIHSGSYKTLNNLLKYDIDPDVKDLIGEIIIFASKDDTKGILESVKIFSKGLEVEPTYLKEMGHFTREDMGTEKFPELLEAILRPQDLRLHNLPA